MTCTRCGGFVVIQRYSDGGSEDTGFPVERCVNCGWIGDPVIHANHRQIHRSDMRTSIQAGH